MNQVEFDDQNFMNWSANKHCAVQPREWSGLRAPSAVLVHLTTRSGDLRPRRMSLTSLGAFKANLALASVGASFC